METRIRRDLILEGLHCPACLRKIESEIGKIKNVRTRMNSASSTVTVSAQSDDGLENVRNIIHSIIQKDGHQISIREKSPRTIKNVYRIDGLSCASCAVKIEKEICSHDKTAFADLNFATSVLTAETSDMETFETALSEAVRKYEPEAVVTKIKDEKEEKEAEFLGWEIAVLSVSFILLMIAGFVPMNEGLKLALFILDYLVIGGKVLLSAIRNIIRKNYFDENFLMAIATIGAFAIHEYSEAVSVMLFYRVGELFQDLAVEKSRKSISSLMDIKPDYANVRTGNEIVKTGVDDVQIGDTVIVKAGEKVPLDGVVLEGNSYVDTSNLTGESSLREVGAGSEILSGFINQNGVLTVEVTKDSRESTVSKILELVEHANNRKAPTEQFMTKFAKYYTPIVVGIAFLLAFVPTFIFGKPFGEWLSRALIFLVISCPCALVISIPIGFFGGLGAASQKGIIIKGSNYLEALNKLEMVVFDKTGTLTEGIFRVRELHPKSSVSEFDLLTYAAYAESLSDHPIAKSILQSYHGEIDREQVRDYEELPGYGISAVVFGKKVLLGNKRLMDLVPVNTDLVSAPGTILYLSVDAKYLGYIIIGDTVKADAHGLAKALGDLGIRTAMLTGDSRQQAENIGRELDIDELYSELLPQQKVKIMDTLKETSHGNIAYVGDGINDAPVLSMSDIGVAMGGMGSDAAIEAADIIFMNDEPSKILTAVKIAKRTRKIVWESIIFALTVKLLFLILGTLSLAGMWHAVFADVGVSLIAVLNAMRILRVNRL